MVLQLQWAWRTGFNNFIARKKIQQTVDNNNNKKKHDKQTIHTFWFIFEFQFEQHIDHYVFTAWKNYIWEDGLRLSLLTHNLPSIVIVLKSYNNCFPRKM